MADRRRRIPFTPRSRRAGGEPISRSVERVLSDHRVADDIRHTQLYADWPAIVGRRLAARTRPGYLSRGVLEIHVYSASWLRELSRLSDDVVARINRSLDTDSGVRVEDISFTLCPADQRPVPAPGRGARTTRAGERVTPRPASPERAAAIERESRAIEDDELRAIVSRVRRRYDL